MAEGVLFNIAEELIKKLGSLAAQEVALWCCVKDELSKLGGTVTRIKAVLDDATEKTRKQNNQVKDWLGKLQEAVYDAEDLLEDFSSEVQRKKLVYGNEVSKEVGVFFSRSNQFVYGLQVCHKVKALRERLADIDADSKQFNFEVRDEEKVSLSMVREQTTSSEPEVIVGREGDKVALKTFLLNSNYDQNVSVVSIVGIGGLGKTTLAQHVFNDAQVNVHFGLKLWVSVSGGLDIKKILKLAVGRDSDHIEDLKNELEKKIQKNKYLLVLDDVWDGEDFQDDGEKWDRLKQLLPRDAVGSKIMVTTRSLVIATFTSTVPPHVLQGLSEDASWDLFEKKAFPQSQKSNHVGNVNEVIRREIVKRCCGVPLVVKAIARLMSLKDRAQWLSFILNELPGSVRDDNIIQTLRLSYDPLPSYMKHCFAYCSLFPKGHKIDVKSLIQLWIAQGFISSSGGESLEIAGLRCLENLVWRSFFHEVGKDNLGNVESCKMHDFMHDLATKVAGFESTKVDTRGGNRISDLTRHVSFDMELDLSHQIPIPSPSAKRLRTLVMLGGKRYSWRRNVTLGGKWIEDRWESICQDFRCLRVFDLHGLGIEKVSPSIEKFKLLKYLDISYNDMEALPNSITNLINLQVLKLNGCKYLKALPRDINKLINLRHLDLGCSDDDDLCDSLKYMPCGIGKLTSLQTLSCFVVAKTSPESKMVGGLDELGRLNELRGRLEIKVKGYERNCCISEFEGAKLIEKQYLQSLTIAWGWVSDSEIDLYDKMLQRLQPHSNLQVLSVVGYGGRRLILQSLQPHLNLQELSVEGYGGMSLPSWLLHVTNLVKISLSFCERLNHIPPLDGIPSLEKLSIEYLYNLEYIDSEGVGGRGVPTFFPSLKKLRISCCHSLKGWWKKRDEINDDIEESTTTTEEELMMLSFPRLSSLEIVKCPKLSSMPLFPTLDDELFLSETSSVPLQQTMKVRGWKSTSSVSFSSSSSSSFVHPLSKLKSLAIMCIEDLEYLLEDVLQNLSSLQRLSIENCQRLKALHLPDQGMHSLQSLSIMNCRRLKALHLPDQGMHSLKRLSIWDCRELRSLSGSQSQGIPNLPSLQELIITECSEELSGRLREGKEAVEYWPNIAHIPNIIIGAYYIQKDGRYAKEENLLAVLFLEFVLLLFDSILSLFIIAISPLCCFYSFPIYYLIKLILFWNIHNIIVKHGDCVIL